MKGAGHCPGAGTTATTQRIVSKGGDVGVIACEFYASYKRRGQQVTITWDTTTVTILDAAGLTIAQYAKPTQRRDWHGPAKTSPSTKS